MFSQGQLWTLSLRNSSKVDFAPFCHSVLDTESRDFNVLQKHWTPVFTGVTTFYENIKLRFHELPCSATPYLKFSSCVVLAPGMAVCKGKMRISTGV